MSQMASLISPRPLPYHQQQQPQLTSSSNTSSSSNNNNTYSLQSHTQQQQQIHSQNQSHGLTQQNLTSQGGQGQGQGQRGAGLSTYSGTPPISTPGLGGVGGVGGLGLGGSGGGLLSLSQHQQLQLHQQSQQQAQLQQQQQQGGGGGGGLGAVGTPGGQFGLGLGSLGGGGGGGGMLNLTPTSAGGGRNTPGRPASGASGLIVGGIIGTTGGGMGTPGIGGGGGGLGGGMGGQGQGEDTKIHALVVDLMDPTTREAALLELSKKREQYDDLALVLWHSFGIMPILLQEIVSVYPLLSPPNLTAHVSNRVCNALALLQCVASHTETRALFLSAHIPLFLYPFLNTTSKTRPFEYLRLTSLGVIGALVKQNDNSTVIHFLLSTEIIPLCLRIMETGSELSKTVAIFIVQKILLDETGLTYICHTYERFYAVGTVLSNMVNQLVESQAVRLLKHVVRCYLRLSDNMRAREALKACLPEPLRDQTFSVLLKGDMVTKRCLTTLLNNLNEPVQQ